MRGLDLADVRAPGVSAVQGDLRRPEDCARLVEGGKGGTLFHCAGIIHPRRVREFYEINLDGCRNALEAAAAAGLRRAVVVSSNSPCGANPHPGHLFDESSPYCPYRHYGRSKMLMELEARRFQEAGRLEVVIVRAPWFYGPNQPPRQSLFFRMVRAGGAPVVGHGRYLRSMAYLENLCDGLRLAAAVPAAAGKTYWIADARPYEWREVIDTVERVLERDFKLPVSGKRLRLPELAGHAASVCDGVLQGVGLYHQKLHVLAETVQDIACSIEKARRELGYEPKVALEEGMRRSIAWCIERGIEI